MFVFARRCRLPPVKVEFGIMEGVALPSGTLTFLLSDVEGSTAAWDTARDAMALALPRSLDLVEEVANGHGGVLPVEQGEGDSRLAVFARAADALAAALTRDRGHQPEPLGVTGEVVWRGPTHDAGGRTRR
jgi:class 3 adenylate cyclase